MKELNDEELQEIGGGASDNIRYCKVNTKIYNQSNMRTVLIGVLPKGTKVKVLAYSAHKQGQNMNWIGRVDGGDGTQVQVMEGSFAGKKGIVNYTRISNQRTRPR